MLEQLLDSIIITYSVLSIIFCFYMVFSNIGGE